MRYDVWGFPVFKYTIDDPDTALNQQIQKCSRRMLSELDIPLEDFTMNKSDSCIPQAPMFSFIYFTQYDPKFVFLNPSLAHDIYGDWISTVTAFEPEFSPDILQGDILIFPSFLLHRVDNSTMTFSGILYRTTDKKNIHQ